ncbi:hypothetical protein PPL_07818 [Heterostelium album PN500]|uniref:MACPF domain-containing protein n=1 Tax=Heterostelium pallidum (strain ATCC 26659 / Pp 5 / PN500) TaxID=670386 RepID=D3BH16_HETP5|nr:hypothetical protein PPL_07818 [Heterostelium album PN500]EFA79400.1 hypothetical protein PPL_07818 [Heterostelium album PN500]|eukprot:XP_020431521.1 hypothetical protein PPL_07818 [Heterostelium album PN500]
MGSEVYVDPNSNCAGNNGCGSYKNPYPDIQTALDFNKDQSSLVIIAMPGTYRGPNNKELLINFNVEIRSEGGYSATIIDCENAGSAFTIQFSNSFILSGFTITNCNSQTGGAISATDSNVNVKESKFINNKGYQGGAIYLDKTNFNLENSFISKNQALDKGAAIYISDSSSNILSTEIKCNTGNEIQLIGTSMMLFSTDLSKVAVNCDDSSSIDSDNGASYCSLSNNQQCTLEPNSAIQKDLTGSSSDSSSESDFLSIQPGWKFRSFQSCIIPEPTQFQGDIIIPSECGVIPTNYLINPEFSNWIRSAKCPVSGILESDIQINKTIDYDFKLEATNLGVVVYVDNTVLFDSYFSNEKIKSFRTKLLSSKQEYHSVTILIFSASSGQRSLSLKWKSSDSGEYQSLNSYLILEESKPAPICGDKICNEAPESCLLDCFDQIVNDCSGQAPPIGMPNKFKGGMSNIQTQILDNYYLFTLPGLNYMGHGVDLETMEDNAAPLFSISYCSNQSFSTLEDQYRDMVYTIPHGFSAQKSIKCDYSTMSSFSSTAKSFSYKKGINAGIHTEAHLEMDYWLVEASLQLAFSLDFGMQFAGGYDSTVSGSIASTKFQCEIYKAHNNDPKFHPKFIQDISKVKSVDDMMVVVKKYGIFYKETATLGGTLEQVSKVSQVNFASRSSNSLDINLALSFAAQASGFGMKGGGSFEGYFDYSSSESKQNGFEQSSSFSRIIVKGGAAGSYGANVNNPIKSWADNLDLLPMPIDYKVKYVVDIIPDAWQIKSGSNVKQLWRDAQRKLYVGKFKSIQNTLYSGITVSKGSFENKNAFSSVSTCRYLGSNGNYYDFGEFIKYQNEYYKTNFPLNQDEKYDIYFNLCGNVSLCDNLLGYTNNQACMIESTKNNSLGSGTPEVREIPNGLSLLYTANPSDKKKCGSSNKNRTLSIELLCDLTIDMSISDLSESPECKYKLTIKSKYACPQIHLYDAFTSRFYRLTPETIIGSSPFAVKYQPFDYKPNHIQLYIKLVTSGVPSINDQMVIRLYTQYKTFIEYRLFSEVAFDPLFISFDSNEYPGEIIGMSIILIGAPNIASFFHMSVGYVLAIQQCPDVNGKITSDCVSPKVTSIEKGYSRAYVSAPGDYDYNSGIIFVPLNPFGVGDSSAYSFYK